MLASTLVKDRKPRELIYLFREAMAKTRVIDSVLPQVEALVGDRAFGRELLEQAADMVRDDPTLLTSEMRDVLTFVARKVQAYGPLVRIDREALKKAATPENRLILYADLMQDQKYDEAADTLKQLFADSPEARTAPRVAALAESYFMDGQLELAFDAAKEAHRLDDADPSAHFLLALLLNRLGRGADALQEYQEFLKRHGDNEDLVIRAHAGMSSVYVDMNDYAKGEAELAELLQRNPDDAGINNDLGYLYAEQGKNLEQAEKMIRKALSEEPKNGSYLDSLGWVLYKKGKVSEAVDYLRQAAAEPSPQPTRLDHLGDALYRLGKYDEAEKVWKQAEQLAARPKPPDKRLDSIRKKLQELRQVRAETSKNHE
jgi:Tfp pilus assembly protein PilF